MKKSVEKTIITLSFMAIVLGGGYWSNAYRFTDELIASVMGEIQTERNIKKGTHTDYDENAIENTELRAKDMDGNLIPTYAETSADFLEHLPFKRRMVDINGVLAKSLNMRDLYRKNGGNVLKNGYVVGIYPYTSTDYEIQQITEFRSYLDKKGIQLLYVNEPTKYINDQVIIEDLGRVSYINDNTDRFLERLKDNGISYIDLRDDIVEKEMDSFDLFYRTDHHWTAYAGKMAAESIADALNKNFGYNIDLSIYDDDKFAYKEFKNAWLGEQGKKFGESFVGLDDFELILPEYDTLFHITKGEDVIEGCFADVLVDQECYLPENNEDVYSASSWHYSYMGQTGINGTKIENRLNVEGKRVLVLGDSYEQVTIPYLSLGISEIQCLVLRNYAGSVREYIENHEIDTVVIAYASFMIGAHDNETSANYAMFDFN